MALSEATRKMIEDKLTTFCERRVPAHLRAEIRLHYRVRGNSVTLFEGRPAFRLPGEWIEVSVAQFRYNPTSGKWTLYCADRNSRWHEYYDTLPTRNFDKLLAEVDEDPTGIFWG